MCGNKFNSLGNFKVLIANEEQLSHIADLLLSVGQKMSIEDKVKYPYYLICSTGRSCAWIINVGEDLCGFKEVSQLFLEDSIVFDRHNKNDATHAIHYRIGKSVMYRKFFGVYHYYDILTGWTPTKISSKTIESCPKIIEKEQENIKDEEMLISGKEAFDAAYNGEDVLWRWVLSSDNIDEWKVLENSTSWSIDTLKGNSYEFKRKPKTMTIGSIEVPAPFKPVEGETYWHIDPSQPDGYHFNNQLDRYSIFGAWRTEAQIKQVVAALQILHRFET